MYSYKSIIDEGCNDELNVTSLFTDHLEIPKSEPFLPPKTDSNSYFLLNSKQAPYKYTQNIGLYLNATSETYRQILTQPECFVDNLRKFSAVVLAEHIDELVGNPPYTFTKQLRNIYRLRTLETYYQRRYVRIIPWIPFYSEKCFSKFFLNEAIAFAGLVSQSIIAIPAVDLFCGSGGLQSYLRMLRELINNLYPSSIYIFSKSSKTYQIDLEELSTINVIYVNLNNNREVKYGNY